MYKKKLQDLKNVGKATLEDLSVLGIDSVDELALCDPTKLFQLLEEKTQKRQNPCVWDLFAAIIQEAKTGKATSWWEWSKKRKTLEKKGLDIHKRSS